MATAEARNAGTATVAPTPDTRPSDASGDRMKFVPRHVGRNVFPNFLLFGRLVRLAYKEHLTAVRDLTFGYTASYARLLTDVLHLRNTLLQTLDPAVIGKLDSGDEVFVNLLGPGGYEFTVGFLALMALGAVIVPISPALPVREAAYFVRKCKAVAVLTADISTELGSSLAAYIAESGDVSFRSIPIKPNVSATQCMAPSQFQVSSDHYLDINASGLVIFTSGTTGPPKGAVKRRGFFHDVAMTFGDQHGLQEGDVVLHVLPVHHATGITVTLLPFLYHGGCIEFRSGGFDPKWTWERIRQGGLTYFSGVPTIYMRLMQHYERHFVDLPEAVRTEYIGGVRGFRAMLCGTSALPRPLQQKWVKLRDGKLICTRYGGTEFSNGITVTPWSTGVPDGSVGEKAPGVDLKLSNGDEGEILMRSPNMFSKYAFDPEATAEAHDQDGYFKTGDIARREGKHYFILGRASVDILKSGGYKISALDVEREILGLDYVAEVMVVGVEDEEFGQRVAAAVVLKPGVSQNLTIEKLRADLRDDLAGYKMPTILRVVEDIPKSPTGKVVKKTLGLQLFPAQGCTDVQIWRSRKKVSKL